MKRFDTIGNQTRDIPICSALPQPLRYRVPLPLRVYSYYLCRLTGSLGCFCDSLLNIAISIFVVQNSVVWKEHFEIVLGLEKIN
jgi:hypothetical protein